MVDLRFHHPSLFKPHRSPWPSDGGWWERWVYTDAAMASDEPMPVACKASSRFKLWRLVRKVKKEGAV